jgi:hypothetical protein
MSPGNRLLVALICSLSSCGALASAAGADTPLLPDADPFYTAPAGLGSQPPGTVLRSREVQVTGLGIPIPATSYQLLYRSNDVKGKPIAAVTTLLVPVTPSALDPRPLVSYQMAIDSLGSQCNPSYTLRTGTQKELISVVPLLSLGYAVAVPDFEGPRNAYTAGFVAAHTVLDGIRASESFKPSGLAGNRTPVGLWGYSGGGQATAWAMEQQPVYAPDLKLTAVAAGGVPPDVEEVARAIDGGVFFGVFLAASVGLNREYPEMNFDAILNEKGKAEKKTVETQCAEQLVTGYPFQKMSDLTTEKDPLNLPRIRAVVEANKLGKVTPKVPLYIYHSVADELIPVGGPDRLVTKYCQEGATVHYQRDVLGEHVAYAFAGAPQALTYLTAVFAGQPPGTNCPTVLRNGPGAVTAPSPTTRVGVCTKGRAMTVRLARRRGERIRRVVARVGRRRVASARGRNLRTLQITGLAPGRRTIRLTIVSNKRTRTISIRRTVRCA